MDRVALTQAKIRYYAPEFKIEINSAELKAEVSHTILSLRVEQEVNRTNAFDFVIQDEFKVGAFKWLGHEPFKFGNTVSVSMGYAGHVIKMVEGKIQNIDANFFEGTAPTFTARGSDNAYEFLTTPSDTKVFIQKTDSAIVREIAQMAHLEAVVDETEEVAPTKTKRGGRSYFDFLRHLAAANRYEFYLSGRQLCFTMPKKDKEPSATLKWGKDIISFKPMLNTSQAVTKVVVRGWDRSGGQRIEASASAGDEQTQEQGRRLASQIAREIYGDVVRVITDRPVRSVREARQEAQGELERASDNFITGTVETIGIPELRPRECIRINGLGEWFSGKYYIEKITHRIDQNGYRSSFNVKRNAL